MKDLRAKILEAIKENDLSCGCCGPTDLELSATAVMRVINEELPAFTVAGNPSDSHCGSSSDE